MKRIASTVITIGGSKGLGNATMRQLAQDLPTGSTFIFTGRNIKQLEDEARELREKFTNQHFNPLCIDLDNVDGLLIKETVLSLSAANDTKNIILVLSAFQLGFCGPVGLLDPVEVSRYLNCNVTRFAPKKFLTDLVIIFKAWYKSFKTFLKLGWS